MLSDLWNYYASLALGSPDAARLRVRGITIVHLPFVTPSDLKPAAERYDHFDSWDATGIKLPHAYRSPPVAVARYRSGRVPDWTSR